MPRKVTVQQPQRRREGVNRAQLKALAARQAMTTAAVSSARAAAEESVDEAAGALPVDYSGALPRARRRVVLTREEEFGFIRRDLIRLTFISAGLLVLMFVLLVVLR